MNDKFKIDYIKKTLSEYERITPNKGILSLDEIKSIVYNSFKDTDVTFIFFSARYSGGHGNDDDNNKKILKEL